MTRRAWTEAKTGADLVKRVQALPGFGKQKAQIFVALLAKQLDVKPEGWEQAAGDYALDGYRSVADVVDEATCSACVTTRGPGRPKSRRREHPQMRCSHRSSDLDVLQQALVVGNQLRGEGSHQDEDLGVVVGRPAAQELGQRLAASLQESRHRGLT